MLKKPKLSLVYWCDGCLGICPSKHPPFTPIPLHPQSLLPPYQLPCKWDGMSAFGSRWSEMITMAQQTSSNVCHFIATETTSRSICNERSAWWRFFSYLHSVPFLKWVLTGFMLLCIARVLMGHSMKRMLFDEVLYCIHFFCVLVLINCHLEIKM